MKSKSKNNKKKGNPENKNRKLEKRSKRLEGAKEEKCSCHAAACTQCSSKCSKCGCDCDGVDPSVVGKSRKRGKAKVYTPIAFDISQRPKRKAAKLARKTIEETSPLECATSKELDALHTDDSEPNLKTWRDLFDAFKWSKSLLKNMPSKKNANQKNLEQNDKLGWSTVRNRLATMFFEGAKLLYPGDPDALMQSVAPDVIGETEASKSLLKLENALLEGYKASPKRSIQRR